MWVRDTEWAVYDIGDAIPAIKNDAIFDKYDKIMAEGNKCLIAHMAASLLAMGSNRSTVTVGLELDLLSVGEMSANLRWEPSQQASECKSVTSDPSPNDSLTTDAELMPSALYFNTKSRSRL